jgi:raffinose/stachyose/melibiose transport system substrate-binding protein
MSRLRFLALVVVLVLVAALGVSACGGDDDDDGGGGNGSASSEPAKAKPGTLEMWVGGNFAGATPGTPYREWLDSQVERFKADNKGSDVKITLLSTDNEQVAAKLQAAFQADKAPDMMLFYSGGYTTPYQDQLLELNEYFDATPGFFDSLAGMDLSCEGLDCAGGENTIIAVPHDFGTYGLFYNKAMFQEAGVEAPIADWDGLLDACDKLKQSGVTPITFGDRDGYSTDNWVTLMYGSYFDEGDIAKVNDGSLKYADPKLVRPLEQLADLRERGCLNEDASSRENFDANSDFTSKKSAMVLMYPAVIPDFKKKLGKDLGIMPIPQASDGPLAGRSVGNAFYNWVITKGSDNPGLAWEFIKVASDETAAGELLTILGTPPANKNVDDSVVSDEFVQFFVDASQDPAMPVLDSVIPVPVALTYYKELQQALSGKKSPQEAMESMDEQLPTLQSDAP